ncbi:hypothetical protein ACIPSA_47880 [Streptomyces sp. NPDC086549]|uniref:hypothetical protein n=1 Tax=Streptomyces sp. NPDC086549 TaxID=3365752 RepID=UPI003824C039
MFTPAPLGDRFVVLAEPREEGLIRHLGISNVSPANNSPRPVRSRRSSLVVAVQNRFGVLEQGDVALVDECNMSAARITLDQDDTALLARRWLSIARWSPSAVANRSEAAAQ